MKNSSHKKESENLENSLVNTIASDSLKEIAIDGVEIALDNFLQDGILKEIPFFGTFYKAFKAAIGTREAIFAKKVFKFLLELRDIPTEKRIAFIKKLEKDERYKYKVGEKLIILIEHLDDMDKPKIIGKLFKAAVKEDIDYETSLRLSAIVQNSFLPYLIKLVPPKTNGKYIDQFTEEHFAQLGIMSIKLERNNRDRYTKTLPPIIKHELNKLGKKLIKFGLSDF